jgi:hypothetical protein
MTSWSRKPWRERMDDLMAAYSKRHPRRPTPILQRLFLWFFCFAAAAWIIYRVCLWAFR